MSPDRDGVFDVLLRMTRWRLGGAATGGRLMSALRSAWGVKLGLPAAKWMLDAGAFFLRTDTEPLLKSRRVVPGRLLEAGFTFAFPEWPQTARNLVERWRAGR